MKYSSGSESSRLSIDQAYSLARRKQREGDTAFARSLFEKILQAHPQHANSLYALGIMAFREKRLDAAEKLFRQAVAIDPHDARFHLNIGVTLQTMGQLEASEEHYRRAIAEAPDNEVAHYSLGVVLQKLERYVEAEPAYRRALELRPDYPQALGNLAVVLSQLNRFDEAETHMQAAIERTPDDPGVLLGMGMLHMQRHDFIAAERPLRRSVELHEDPAALLHLASVLRHNNRHAEAELLARRALQKAGDEPRTLFELALAHRFEPQDPLLAPLQRMAESGKLERKQAIMTLFALAKAYDDLDRWEEAFTTCRRANHMVYRDNPFPLDRYLNRVAWTLQNYARPDLCSTGASGAPAPVFIVGQSRAGKTLVESMLACQEGVYAAGESKELLDFVDRFGRRYESQDGPLLRDKHLSSRECAEFGDEYLRRLRARAPGARLVVSTLPGYYMLVGFIFATLPGARVIHCQRDPLDQCVEMYFRAYSSASMSYTSDPESLAAHYRGYLQVMEHWRSLYGKQLLEVRYEELVADPRAAAERIHAYCGIETGAEAAGIEFHRRGIGRGRHYAPFLPELV